MTREALVLAGHRMVNVAPADRLDTADVPPDTVVVPLPPPHPANAMTSVQNAMSARCLLMIVLRSLLDGKRGAACNYGHGGGCGLGWVGLTGRNDRVRSGCARRRVGAVGPDADPAKQRP